MYTFHSKVSAHDSPPWMLDVHAMCRETRKQEQLESWGDQSDSNLRSRSVVVWPNICTVGALAVCLQKHFTSTHTSKNSSPACSVYMYSLQCPIFKTMFLPMSFTILRWMLNFFGFWICYIRVCGWNPWDCFTFRPCLFYFIFCAEKRRI